MLTWYMIIFAFVTLLGASTLYYQVFRMIQLDAACRDSSTPPSGRYSSQAATTEEAACFFTCSAGRNIPPS